MTDFPTAIITGVTRQLVSAVTSQQSPFTLSSQVQDWGGEVWKISLDVVIKSGAAARSFEAFANSTLNKRRLFVLRDALICNSARTETIAVSGAAQSGNTLVTDGWGASGMSAGDFFSIGSGSDARLYQVTEDCIPVSGVNTLTFVPRLRSSPADGAAVEIAYPIASMMATDDVPSSIQVGVMRFTVNCMEAL